MSAPVLFICPPHFSFPPGFFNFNFLSLLSTFFSIQMDVPDVEESDSNGDAAYSDYFLDYKSICCWKCKLSLKSLEKLIYSFIY
ncbi:hypothetical protein CRE_13442 [Caenorhabditis remanei]|uniref:Uncharacterized protein n=1 Tax=Caenorhabditis remanei TaxID=31234 RepID=E3MR04_CAERE|nr:hypothetical protein CRE_13442 [Caenorhabditis remanei]